jgi:glycosyltransferase involved in cell wall biosynthesis
MGYITYWGVPKIMNESIKYSFVIPVYRSSKTLLELTERIKSEFSKKNEEFEIIFVEDRGGDDSWEYIQRLAKEDARVKGYRFSRNFGQHNALLCGIRNSCGEVIITLDDDLQHSPSTVRALLKKLNEGYEVVYGPPTSETHGVFRDLSSRLTKLALENLIGSENARNISALRVFKARVRDGFSDFKSPSVNIDVLLSLSTNSFSYVRVPHYQREYGESGYNIYKLFKHAMNMLTGYTTLPLKIASAAGVLTATFGFGILAYILFIWLWQGSEVPGFFFLASVISIFSGVQLLALGIFGEYLARMHERTMEKPQYIIEERA